MPKVFNRVITFHVEGEIYDNKAKPESIINNYFWSFEDRNDGNIKILGHHKDARGRITKMTKLPRIHPWKKSDTTMFLNM